MTQHAQALADSRVVGLGLCVWVQVHVLLRQGAGPTDCLKAAFSAHVFLHMLDEEHEERDLKQPSSSGSSTGSSTGGSSAGSSSTAGASTSLSGKGLSGDAAAASTQSSSRGRWGWGRGKAQGGAAAADAAASAAAAAAAAQPLTGAALVRETWNKLAIALPWGQDPGSDYYRRLLERSKCAVDTLYSDFSRQAEKQGWKLAQTMLNPKEARVLRLTPLTA